LVLEELVLRRALDRHLKLQERMVVFLISHTHLLFNPLVAVLGEILVKQ
jgi:hypothetical protein